MAAPGPPLTGMEPSLLSDGHNIPIKWPSWGTGLYMGHQGKSGISSQKVPQAVRQPTPISAAEPNDAFSRLPEVALPRGATAPADDATSVAQVVT